MKSSVLGMLLLVIAATACKKDNDKTPLVAAIDGEQVEVLAGDTVRFHDASQGQAARWKWTFEGGEPETSELSSPAVIYRKAGKYKVVLEISNASQTSSVTKENFVSVGYNEIKVNFTADKTTFLQGQSATFTDKTTGIPETWSWEFIHETQGVLYTSTQRHPVIQFDVPGKYDVKLKASNPGYHGEKTVSEYLNVIDATFVSADLEASTTATYTGGTVTFEDISLGNVEARTWTFEGGHPATSTDASPTVTYANPGRYKVKLTVSNTTRSSDKEIEQYILVVPAADLMAFLPFNNSTADAGPLAMGQSITGTVGFTQPDRNNTTGYSATFNGASGIMLQTQGVLNLGTSDYSIAGWVKTSSTTRMMIWQESGKNGSGDNQSWLRMNDNATTQYLRFNTEEPGGSNILSMAIEGKLNDGQWKHFVCVRKGTNMSVYINGVKAKELTTAVVRNVTGAQNFKIGFQEGATSFSNFFNGQLDDFLIYKRALTEAEIVALYQL